MTDGQYRALVAYLKWWTPVYPQFGLEQALIDLEITDSREEAIEQLATAGYEFSEASGLLKNF